jgi:hypothetical protein
MVNEYQNEFENQEMIELKKVMVASENEAYFVL